MAKFKSCCGKSHDCAKSCWLNSSWLFQPKLQSTFIECHQADTSSWLESNSSLATLSSTGLPWPQCSFGAVDNPAARVPSSASILVDNDRSTSHDFLSQPNENQSLDPTSPWNPSLEPSLVGDNVTNTTSKNFKTEPDELFKVYRVGLPSWDPAQSATLDVFVQASNFNSEGHHKGIHSVGDLLEPEPSDISNPNTPSSFSTTRTDLWLHDLDYGPFKNVSEFLLTDWSYWHDTTSFRAMNDLQVHNVILNSKFNTKHHAIYDAKCESKKMDSWLPTSDITSELLPTSSSSSSTPFNATAPDK